MSRVACPLCDATKSRVYDHDRNAVDVVRMRECSACGCRWATRETFDRMIRDATDALGTGARIEGARGPTAPQLDRPQHLPRSRIRRHGPPRPL